MYKSSRFKVLAAVAFIGMLSLGVQAAALEDGGFEVNTFDEDLKVGAPYYTGISADGGIGQNSSIKMYMPLSYNGDGAKHFTALTTLNDENNSVKSVSYAEENVGGDTVLVVELTSPEAIQKGKYTLKTYLWDGVNINRIYCEDFRFSPGNNPGMKSSAWSIGKTFSPTSEDAVEGMTSLMIQSDGTSDSVAYQDGRIEGGQVYRLDFAAKGDSYFGYDITDSDMNSLIGGKKTFDGSAQWSFPSNVAFCTDEDTDIRVTFFDEDGGGVSYIDDVEITNELIANGSFEFDTAGFEADSGCDVTDEYASDGFYSYKIDKSSLRKSVELVGSTAYNVSCDIRGTVGYVLVRDASDKVIAHKTVNSNDDFKNTVFEFHAPEDGEYTVEVMTNELAYADNLRLWQTDRNLIKNSDCEAEFGDESDNWMIRSTKEENTNLTRVDGAQSRYGIMLSGRPKKYTGVGQKVIDNINKYGAGKYKVSGYVKYGAEAGNGTVRVGFFASREKNADNETVDTYYTQDITGVKDSEWTKFEIELDIANFGSDADGNVYEFCPSGSPMNGVLFFDTDKDDTCPDVCISDVKMVAQFDRRVYPEYDEFKEPEIIYWSKNIVENGDFVSGTDNWMIRSTSDNNTKIETIDGHEEGRSGIMLSGRPKKYTGVGQKVIDNINKCGVGKYKVSGYIKYGAEAGNGTVRVGFFASREKDANNKTVDTDYTQDITGVKSNEWTKFEAELDIVNFGKDAEGNIYEFCPSGSTMNGVLFFDTNGDDTCPDICISDVSMVCQVDKDHPYIDLD